MALPLVVLAEGYRLHQRLLAEEFLDRLIITAQEVRLEACLEARQQVEGMAEMGQLHAP